MRRGSGADASARGAQPPSRGRGFSRAVATGALGGALVVAASVAALVAAGGFAPRTGGTTVITEASSATDRLASSTPTVSGQQIYSRDAPGVVEISSTGVTPAQSPGEIVHGESAARGAATGSGFLVDGNGDVLTNWHVVANAMKVSLAIGEHRSPLVARVVGSDPAADLAVLRVSTSGLTLHPLVLGRSRSVAVGDPVFALGDPFGYAGTLTNGIVSALGRKIDAPSGTTISDAIQTDAPINPGSSGGPLLNERGEVIGINSQIVTSGGAGGSVGISFAIPIDTAKAELPVLTRGR